MRAQTATFPAHGLLPKEETGASSFLLNNPDCDGRGTIVAILDTGVDPGAPGLQKTTVDGVHKMLDIIDCTGSGDVVMTEASPAVVGDGSTTTSAVIKSSASPGKLLRLPSSWKNPTGVYKIGQKSALDIFPKPLVDKLRRERKKEFEIANHALLTKTQEELASLTSPTTTILTSTPLLEKEALEERKNDLKARIECLKDMQKDYTDPLFIYDVVSFHDGEKWRVVVDVKQSGDLSEYPLLTNYSDEHQYSCFGDDSMLNFSVNIYDQGGVVSIVTLAGTHGTHVAAISGAYYPNQPELNGVSPGCQIVSLKIGDTRLGSMETGSGLTRAAIELCRLKCHVANMSYGEATSRPDFGSFVELLRDQVINKTGCIFVSSAGNAGPALTTVGAPGGTIPGCIGVGAYVHHSMMDAEYALLDRVDERPYTWSSRGPTSDGDAGVDIYAPGAAITSVPQYTLQASQLMNGTSMSSPNAAGCISVLISALKNSNIPYTPYRVKRAIVNTSKDVNDPMNVGMIQVEKAWEHLSKFKSTCLDIFYDVTVGDDNGKGIYLRGLVETYEIQQIQVQVTPVYANKDSPGQNKNKLDLEIRVRLESKCRWISVPDFLLLNNGGRGFTVQVDTATLAPGFHFAEIAAYDSNQTEVGPLFKIPVTVCKPEQQSVVVSSNTALLSNKGSNNNNNHFPESYRFENVTFSPGSIHRRFVHVPYNSNFAELTIRCERRATPARLIVHMMQLNQQTRYEKFENEFAFSLGSVESDDSSEPTEWKKFFTVVPGLSMEVCLAQFWSSLGTSKVDFELKFHGLLCSVTGTATGADRVAAGAYGDGLFLNSSNNGFTRIDISAPLRKEHISFSASLDTLRRFIRPTDSIVKSLKSRDVLPDSRQVHELVLTYSVKVSEASSITCRFPRMNDVLYDSIFENFCVIVFDQNKKVVSFQDVYAKSVKVTEGSFTIKVQVASWRLDLLEKLQGMILVLDSSLAKSISLSTHASLADCLASSDSFKKKLLHKGERAVVFVGGLDESSLPKDSKAGDLLLGKLDLVGGGAKLDGGNSLYHISYLVPSEFKPKDSSSIVSYTHLRPLPAASEPEKDDPSLKRREAVRDLEIEWISKIKDETELAALLTRLEQEWPQHLPLFMKKLGVQKEAMEKAVNEWSSDKTDSEKATTLKLKIASVQQSADALIALIDQGALAKYLGVKHDNSTDKDKTAKKEMERQKDALIAANLAKALAISHSFNAEKDGGDESNDSKLMSLFDGAMLELVKWLPDPPTSNGKYLLLWVWKRRKEELLGITLKAINKYIGDAKNHVDEESAGESGIIQKLNAAKKEILAELGWNIWVDNEERWKEIKYPKVYAQF